MAKSNRWWIQSTNYKTLKKYRGGVFCDDTFIPMSTWDNYLNKLRDITMGDDIWNPFKNVWDKVEKVAWAWEEVRSPTGKMIGRFIGGFIIRTQAGDSIYDTPWYMKKNLPDYPKEGPPKPAPKSEVYDEYFHDDIDDYYAGDSWY